MSEQEKKQLRQHFRDITEYNMRKQAEESKFRTQNIKSGQTFGGKMSIQEIEERMAEAEMWYSNFLQSLGYDINEDSNMKNTPKRVVKMMFNEIARGTYLEEPKITTFPNKENYDGIIFQGNIVIKSLCSHHMAFIFGKCHIAYIPGDSVIGLSKINRIVDYFARRPQLQEQLTQQIHTRLNELLVGNNGVAVVIEATHTCVSMRGIEHDSTMTTSKLSGKFFSNEVGTRHEFFKMIDKLK